MTERVQPSEVWSASVPGELDLETDDATVIARSTRAPQEFAAIFDRHAGDVHCYLSRHRPTHRKVRTASWTTVSVAVAGAVVVLVGTTSTPTTPVHPVSPGGTTSPANVTLTLNEAADQAIEQKDEPILPGQYRYVSERISVVGTAWNADRLTLAWRVRTTETTWVPYDESGIWTKDVDQDAPPEILVDDGATEADRSTLDSGPSLGRRTALCGDFRSRSADPCHREFNDQGLTSAMIATLPRDPTTLLRDHLGNSLEQALQRCDIWLRSGLVPSDLRAALYRALALVPGIRITDDLANLDGREGVAFGGKGTEIIIDPATGQYIGFRSTDDGTQGTPRGTVRDSSSLVTGVVNNVGDVPSR
ncbi:CU044_5270 family protein [Actinophytocola oryzae]|uniref:CU044_5270 family protein n=1 Tax=Actinophytocola oryzae TaxID=502181 RepID=A0A4R7VVP6_9PSEU|nr:CU044_5270 family protein [Actinophytocola oryzae]TDV53952.1 hypothetical protein CLV71_104420 [Actinophytocola oryzae]